MNPLAKLADAASPEAMGAAIDAMTPDEVLVLAEVVAGVLVPAIERKLAAPGAGAPAQPGPTVPPMAMA